MKFWMFHLMPWPYLPNDFDEKYDTAWVTCPNALFDPERGPEVYHRYINQLAYADELGFDGVVIYEHHQNAYGIMPSPNLIAAAHSQPMQKPHPPVWIPGVGSIETMELVAERGFIYAALTYAHVDSFRQNAAFFQQTVARVGRTYNPEMLGWLVPMYVAETDQQAREEAEEHVWYFIDKLIKGFAGKGRTWMPPGYTSLKSLQRLQEINALGGDKAPTNWQLGHARSWADVEAGGSVLIGSPQTVREQLLKYVLEFKVGHILALPQFGSLPDHLTRKNMALLASEVFPYVRKYAEAEFGALPGVQSQQTAAHA